jgi:hypothetical protein
MLNGQLLIHGADIEAISRKVVKRSGLHLSFHKEEEYVAELIAHAWELSLGHDERLHPGKFARGLGRILPLRLIDIVRREEGRTRWQFADRTHERPARYTLSVDATSLDADNRVWDGEVDNAASRASVHRGSRMGEAHAALSVDASADSATSLARALSSRSSEPPRHDLQAGTGRKGCAGRGDTETGGMREAA